LVVRLAGSLEDIIACFNSHQTTRMSVANKISPRRGNKSPAREELAKAILENQLSLDDRVKLMKGASAEDIEEYKRTEIIRRSVNDVKTRAAVEAERRRSPIKTYSNVKSKVAGNMKSLKKAKKMNSLVEEQKQLHNSVLAGNFDSDVAQRLAQRAAAGSPERIAAIQQKQAEINNMVQEFNSRRLDGSSFVVDEQQ